MKPNEIYQGPQAPTPPPASRNRHQRRSEKARRGGPEDAGYLYALRLIGGEDMVRLLQAAAGGDQRAATTLRAAINVVTQVGSADKSGSPKLCLTCDNELRDLAFLPVLALPQGDSPERIVGAAMCAQCTHHPYVVENAVIAFRKVWPDLRHIGGGS